MKRAEYYEVKEDAYLYPSVSKRAGDREKLEESVRQWCAYELVRAYGIPIEEVEFEREVKVGSKTYRIDILVSHRGKPYVVVECKLRDHKKHDEAVAQAISYADAQSIRAEFAIYTNGHEWHVQRRIGNRWVPIPDIPREVSRIGAEPITQIFLACDNVAPLLYKLDETVIGEDAQRFLSAMQVFFHGVNVLTEDVDRDLRFGADNLLRVLSLPEAHPNYLLEKLGAACNSFEAYHQKTGIGYEVLPVTWKQSVLAEEHYLHCSLLSMAEHSQGLASSDALVLRLCTALLEYGRHQTDKKRPFPKIDSSLHHALREYLTHALLVNFNAALPDTIDRISNGDVRAYCSSAWERFEQKNRLSFREFASAWLRYIRSRLPFGRNRIKHVTIPVVLDSGGPKSSHPVE